MVLTFMKRPTSPLHSESLGTAPEDILYPGSDEEATSHERAKKRLRVEILGKQYLEGRPLFIQSAALRGPFEDGWINPWASKKRVYGVEDVDRSSEALRALGESLPRYAETEAEIVPSVESRMPAGLGYGKLNERLENHDSSPSQTFTHEGMAEKRTMYGKPNPIQDRRGDEAYRVRDATAPERMSKQWLKTDELYLQAGLRSNMRSPTPTPATKRRSKSYANVSAPYEHTYRSTTLPPRLAPQIRPLRRKDQEQALAPINEPAESKIKTGPQTATLGAPVENAAYPIVNPVEDLKIRVRERSLSRADEDIRYGYKEVKRLSQQAVRQANAEYGHLQARKVSQEAALRAEQKSSIKPSRLAPYVSDHTLSNEAVSDALRAVTKAPKPLPHAVPPSTYLPEFQYRYAQKPISSSTSRENPAFVVAPEGKRSRSDSSSSSGSSEFAEAYEAAQAQAASRSWASSKSSSPAIEGPDEATSVQKNRQTMRRLTFSPSGRAKLERNPSRPNSSSSAAGPPVSSSNNAEGNLRGLLFDEGSVPLKISTKSSNRLLTSGSRSGNSEVLPDAQPVSEVVAPPGLTPSGRSTNLLQTDRQSSKLQRPYEGDSYLDLSTQAAVLRAQRSFKEDVLSSLEELPNRIETNSGSAAKYVRRDVTPRMRNCHDNDAANAQLIQLHSSDDEELMSTQAMINAISPFAVTTIKKRPPFLKDSIRFVSSPTVARTATIGMLNSPTPAQIPSPGTPTSAPFRNHSLSMSTSPSPTPSPTADKSPPIPILQPDTISKPPSSLTSFSILPNGTLNETSVYQQDGQQRQYDDFDTSLPLDPLVAYDEGNGDRQRQFGRWNLNAAIEEASSFLGDWNVESEARKEGSSSRKRQKDGSGRSILSVGRGD